MFPKFHKPLLMSTLLGAALSAMAMGPTSAGELYIYEHNLSVIDWFVVGDKIKATYSRPKPSLEAAGVKEGAVLFEGDYEGNRIVGTAYAFKSGCAPAPYQVIGMEQGSQIILRGPGPVRSKTGCDVIGYSAKSPHAELKFNYSATHH
jgi:hypothetical protein